MELRKNCTIVTILHLICSAIADCPDACVCKHMSNGTHVTCMGTHNVKHFAIVLPKDTYKLVIQDIPINQSEIAEILKPPCNLRILSISNTGITEFTWEMFRTLKQLNELHLKKCNKVEKIHEDAFQSLENLRIFYISENKHVNFQDLGKAIRNLPTKNLDVFAFEKQGIKQDNNALTTDFFRGLENKSLKILIKRNNKISRIQSGFSQYLKNVTCWLVNGNVVLEVREYESFLLEQMRFWDVSFNTRLQPNSDSELNFENICVEPFPKDTEVKELDPDILKETEALLDELCHNVYSMPPNLRYVYNHNIYIGTARIYSSYTKLTSHSYCYSPDNNIRYIDSYNNAIDYKEPKIGLVRLQYYNIQNSHQSGLPYHSFAHFPSLNTLLLGGNRLGSWFTKGNATFALRKLYKLTSFDLANNDISDISAQDLKYLFTIKNVNLSGNHLTSNSFYVAFRGQFKHFNLSNNKLTFLPPLFRQSIDKMPTMRNFTIDLSYNPIQCHCDNLDFLQWLIKNQDIFHKFEHYTCDVDSKQENIRDILQLKSLANCNSNIKLIITSVSATITAITLTIILGWYFQLINKLNRIRFRVYVRIKQIQYRYTHGYKLLHHKHDCVYNAYVIHDERDINFVVNSAAEMERRQKKLYSPCINFRPGLIIEGVVEGLTKSEFSLVMITHNFISQFREYEITMSIVLGRKFVVLMVDDVQLDALPPALWFLYRSPDVKRFKAGDPTTKLWDDVAKAITLRDDYVFSTNF